LFSVETFAADHSLVPPETRVLAAVSSGADSMALLWWLLSLNRKIVVGHVNHALTELRPGECARDEEFVRTKCAALGVEFRSVTVELPRRSGHINEVVAREARYLALAEMARQNGCSLVATAHTATDGLETALLNLMRGAGAGGWLGIAARRVLDGEIDLVRPFWQLPRQATRQILLANNWLWREDASNADPLFRRNRVRGEVLPILGEISGQPPDHLAVRYARNARIARDEAQYLDKLAAEALFSLIVKQDEDLVVLRGTSFCELDVALQRRVLRKAAQLLLPEARNLESDKIEATRLAVTMGTKRTVWTWRKELRVEWTGSSAGNRLRFWRVKSI
jgi:tRNA(Ile)-lysidine synthase